jgi:hypothetical protein
MLRLTGLDWTRYANTRRIVTATTAGNPSPARYSRVGASPRRLRPLTFEQLEDRTVLSHSNLPPLTVDFGYVMTDRFGIRDPATGLIIMHSADSLNPIDVVSTAQYVNPPDGFEVVFTAETSVHNNLFHWKIDGNLPAPIDQYVAISTFTAHLKEGIYTVTVTAEGMEGTTAPATKTVVVNDMLIVAMGDSFASGEANPEIGRRGEVAFSNISHSTTLGDAVWADGLTDDANKSHVEAHRSSTAAFAQAALAIENSDSHTSVTFISVAASGAGINSGLLGSKPGRENHAYTIPPQIDSVVNVVGGRQIDMLFLSMGINEVDFGDVLEQLIASAIPLYGAKSQAQMEAEVAPKLVSLHDNYDRLSSVLRSKLNVGSTYVLQYPDPFNHAVPPGSIEPPNYVTCDQSLDDVFPVPSAYVTAGQVLWGRNTVLNPLNTAVRDAAARNGWTLVDGVAALFNTHGYCAENPYDSPNTEKIRWIRTATESADRQGASPDDHPLSILGLPIANVSSVTKGTIHPNEWGHLAVANSLLEVVNNSVLFRTGVPVVPFPSQGLQETPFDGRFQLTDNYARARGFAGGLPNFYEANLGLPLGKVFGTLLLKPGTADTFNNITSGDLESNFQAANQSVLSSTFYVGAFPTFVYPSPFSTIKTVLIKSGFADRMSVAESDLGGPFGGDPVEAVGARFRAVFDFAKRTKDAAGNFYVGGFPTFIDQPAEGKYGVVLLKATGAEWRNVPAIDLVSKVTAKDDGDWGYRQAGAWQTLSPTSAGYQSDYRASFAGLGENTATWTIAMAPGRYELFTRWVPGVSAFDAPYTIWDGTTNRTGPSVPLTFQGRIQATDDFATRHFYAGGLPNFQEAIPGSPPGRVYGTLLLKPGTADRIGRELLFTDNRFVNVDNYLANTPGLNAIYAGGYPTFRTIALGTFPSLTTVEEFVRIKNFAPDGSRVAVHMDLPVEGPEGLEGPLGLGRAILTAEDRFLAVDNYVRKKLNKDAGFEKYAGGFPNFQEAGSRGSASEPFVYGAVILLKSNTDRRDAPAYAFDSTLAVRRDQNRSPDAAFFGGQMWSSLGTYQINSGVVTVQLSNEVTDFLTRGTVRPVVADGVLAVLASSASPLLAAGVPVKGAGKPTALTSAMLQPIISAAQAQWTASLGPASGQVLAGVNFQIFDLAGSLLGLTSGSTVWIDVNAAGRGWFVDPTPQDSLEYQARPNHELVAVGKGPAAKRIDLLTVVMHELGHVLGLGDLDAQTYHGEVMAETLASGIRRVPQAAPRLAASTPSVPIALITPASASHRQRDVPAVDRTFGDVKNWLFERTQQDELLSLLAGDGAPPRKFRR